VWNRFSGFTRLFILLGSLALLGLVKLLFDNLLYAWVMAKLKQIAGIEEGDLIALLTGNVLPIGTTAVVVWFLYRVAKVHHDKQNLDNTIEFAWDVATGTQVVPSDGKYNRLTLAPIPVERGGGTGISHGPPGVAYCVVPGPPISSGGPTLEGRFWPSVCARPEPSWRIPVAVFLRRGVRLRDDAPFRGLARPMMSQ
jgi:hypothetical protein